MAIKLKQPKDQRQASQNELLDRSVIQLNDAFVALLDAPPNPAPNPAPNPNDRLRKTLQSRPPWE